MQRPGYALTMPAVVRRAASLFADDEFIVMPDRRITFGELETHSRALAKQLLAAERRQRAPRGHPPAHGTRMGGGLRSCQPHRSRSHAIQHALSTNRAPDRDAHRGRCRADIGTCGCSAKITRASWRRQCPGCVARRPGVCDCQRFHFCGRSSCSARVTVVGRDWRSRLRAISLASMTSCSRRLRPR